MAGWTVRKGQILEILYTKKQQELDMAYICGARERVKFNVMLILKASVTRRIVVFSW